MLLAVLGEMSASMLMSDILCTMWFQAERAVIVVADGMDERSQGCILRPFAAVQEIISLNNMFKYKKEFHLRLAQWL